MSEIKKKDFCGNCGKYGHVFSKCREPITSLGMINIKFDYNEENIYPYLVNKYGQYTVDEDGYKNLILPLNNTINNKKISDVRQFCLYKNSIKFLMIQRKDTLGYIEFIRGNYNVKDSQHIISLFEQMVQDEIDNIKNNELDYLWKEIWADTHDKKNFEQEYKQSKKKFNELKYGNLEKNLDFYVKNVKPDFDFPEWGFPKGRRNYYEKNYECAIREFNEESGFKKEDYVVLNRLHSLNEVFIGTNGIKYKHIYYIGLSHSDKKVSINMENKSQCNEIGDIGWFSYEEAEQLIRPYHFRRKKILTELFMFLVNDIIENIKLNVSIK